MASKVVVARPRKASRTRLRDSARLPPHATRLVADEELSSCVTAVPPSTYTEHQITRPTAGPRSRNESLSVRCEKAIRTAKIKIDPEAAATSRSCIAPALVLGERDESHPSAASGRRSLPCDPKSVAAHQNFHAPRG